MSCACPSVSCVVNCDNVKSIPKMGDVTVKAQSHMHVINELLNTFN